VVTWRRFTRFPWALYKHPKRSSAGFWPPLKTIVLLIYNSTELADPSSLCYIEAVREMEVRGNINVPVPERYPIHISVLLFERTDLPLGPTRLRRQRRRRASTSSPAGCFYMRSAKFADKHASDQITGALNARTDRRSP
jgi:hypothetical protein